MDETKVDEVVTPEEVETTEEKKEEVVENPDPIV